jgi:hypothetical protein
MAIYKLTVKIKRTQNGRHQKLTTGIYKNNNKLNANKIRKI